jgi:dolichol-phosphate mannosyltransferase
MKFKKVSIIIPTYNESENIKRLIPLLDSILKGYDYEIVVVDDSSPDGTAKVAEKLAEEYPVRVLVRDGKLGLASAILYGFKNANGDVLGVIDADLQHPPQLIRTLVDKIMDGYDIAIASRYVEGGGVEDWSFYRRLVSKGAIMLAKPLTRVKDPMSGYFFLRRSVIDGAHLNPKGYKLLLEILVKGKYEKVAEVPYVFTKRMAGESKLNASEYWEYMRLLVHLYKAKFLRV